MNGIPPLSLNRNKLTGSPIWRSRTPFIIPASSLDHPCITPTLRIHHPRITLASPCYPPTQRITLASPCYPLTQRIPLLSSLLAHHPATLTPSASPLHPAAISSHPVHYPCVPLLPSHPAHHPNCVRIRVPVCAIKVNKSACGGSKQRLIRPLNATCAADCTLCHLYILQDIIIWRI